MDCFQSVIDAVSDWTGLKAIPSLGSLKLEPDAVVLDVPGYSQTDRYSCGAIAAWSIVEMFRPTASFEKFYNLVRPEPGIGVGPKRVIAALRKFKIVTKVRRKMGWNDIKAAIVQGCPMLIGTGVDQDGNGDHWSTLVGYGTRPKRVYLGNQPGVVYNQDVVGWSDFLDLWNPKRQANICRGT